MHEDLETLKSLLLEVGHCRNPPHTLHRLCDVLATIDGVALARLWLVQPGDICEECPLRAECPDRTRCLHLTASAGRSRLDPATQWSALDGAFRRFPIGVRKVGRVAQSAEPLHIERIDAASPWIVRPEWAAAEGIVAFAGQPITHGGEVLGVIGVFLRKPLVPESADWLRMLAQQIGAAIANATAFVEIERLRARLALENEYLREEVQAQDRFGEIVGRSTALGKVMAQIELVAPTPTSVLITGESGVGKELIAGAIHQRSPRADRALVRVNCASIPRELFESEFFGHRRGSFTGAVSDRVGRFEHADGGTLFLDEVGEIPIDLQAKLLRVLQEGTFERIGDSETRRTDVRVVAATNRDLHAEVDAGRFRQDLYYRLSVFPIEVPPLRARKEDVPLLAAHFLDASCRELGMPPRRLKQRHVLELQAYDWPGNVRELQNVIERAVIVSRGGPLRIDLPAEARLPAEGPGAEDDDEDVLTYEQLRMREKRNVIAALRVTRGKVSGPGGAAELLGIKPTTLASRMRAMGIRRGDHRGR
jgi:transcriptional regulator with GAF, ATPase, and Fis domain